MMDETGDDTHAGGCLCGAIRYRIRGSTPEVVHCHCRLCQRAAGAPLITWATVPISDFELTAGSPATYRATPPAKRLFCPICGTQLFFHVDDERRIDVTLASLDDPDRLTPVRNTWAGSRRAWMHGFDEGLPDVDDEGESLI